MKDSLRRDETGDQRATTTQTTLSQNARSIFARQKGQVASKMSKVGNAAGERMMMELDKVQCFNITLEAGVNSEKICRKLKRKN